MAAHRKAGVDSAGEAMIDLKPALKNAAYAEVLDFLNRIATTGQPNEIGAVWMTNIPHNTSFERLLAERGLNAKFINSTGRYFVERQPLPGKQ
jgi:hypothetical protein